MSLSTVGDYEYLFKVMVVGPTATGKTSLIMRFTENSFPTVHNLTIGLDVKHKTIHIDDKTVKLQIWDTAGQERYRSVVNMHYRGAHGCIGVFDMTSRNSFEELKDNLEHVQELYELTGSRIILLGNKSDLQEQRQVTNTEAAKFAESIGCVFFETSAKTAENVESAFQQLAMSLVDKSDAARELPASELMRPRKRSSLIACGKIEIHNKKLSRTNSIQPKTNTDSCC